MTTKSFEFREQIRQKLFSLAKENVEDLKAVALQSFDDFSSAVDEEEITEAHMGSKKKKMKLKKKATY